MICLRVTASLERHDRFFINTLDPTPTCCRPHLSPFPFALSLCTFSPSRIQHTSSSVPSFSTPDPAHLQASGEAVSGAGTSEPQASGEPRGGERRGGACGAKLGCRHPGYECKGACAFTTPSISQIEPMEREDTATCVPAASGCPTPSPHGSRGRRLHRLLKGTPTPPPPPPRQSWPPTPLQLS